MMTRSGWELVHCVGGCLSGVPPPGPQRKAICPAIRSVLSTPAENTDLMAGHIAFRCGPGGGTPLKQPPTQCTSSQPLLVIIFTFPQFWSGVQHAGNELDTMSYT